MIEENNQEETTTVPKETIIQDDGKRRRLFLMLSLTGLILVLVFNGILYFFFYSRKAEIPSWRGVKPGISSKEEVIRTLGAPMEEKQTPLGKTLLYPSDNKVLPNTIVLDENGEVSSIFVEVPADEPIKFSEWLKDYGQPEKEMYNSYSAFTKTYIFPKKGVAAVANKEADQIYSVHYFELTTLDNYLSQWSNYLFEENPYLY